MEAFINIAKLDLLISWPETFIIWLLSFSLWGQQPDKLYRRIVLLTVTSSIATDSSYYFLPLQWQVAFSFVLNASLLALIFREQPWSRRIGVLCAMYILVIVTDSATSLGFTYLLGQPSDKLLEPSSIPWAMLIMYPILALASLAVWQIRMRRPGRLHRLFDMLLDGAQSNMRPILLVIAVNFCLIGTVEIFYLVDQTSGIGRLQPVLVGVSIALCLLSLILMLRALARAKERSARLAQDIYVEEINRMFTSIRGQRHDFLNHVQVMHTMLQMGKIPELKIYMAEVVKETHEVNDIVQHPSPALAAFVRSKTAVAVSRGIAFTCELSDDWSPLSTIRMIDIVKIVGNLVDNAFDEAELQPPESRHVHAVMKCLPSHVELSVINYSGNLRERDKELIFLPGYTTKDREHSGLGLSIVQDRVKHYKGPIAVQTGEQGRIEFRVQLPLRKTSGSGHAG